MPTNLTRICLALIACLAVAGCGKPESPPRVAAASDLRLALTEVVNAYEAEKGQKVDLVFGSSGQLSQQLEHGAPFDMFLSADEKYVLGLEKAGRTEGKGNLYALGRIVLITPRGSPLKAEPDLAGLKDALANGQITRFAIANPDHAPYGERAQEALEHAGLWQSLQGKLVLGENVSQALQFAIAGGAQGGIVALSLVNDPAVAAKADYALIPAGWHRPLKQRMVLMKGAGESARHFYAYLGQPKARAILARHGFMLPTGLR